jgi:hypothetical protein
MTRACAKTHVGSAYDPRMEPSAFVLGALSGLFVGLVGGWFGHRLTMQRSSRDRRIADETDRLDRTQAIFAARVRYVRAWHGAEQDWQSLKAERTRLEAASPMDTPEVVLAGEPAWDAYVETERTLLEEARTKQNAEDQSPARERQERARLASLPVLKVLADRRAKARR